MEEAAAAEVAAEAAEAEAAEAVASAAAFGLRLAVAEAEAVAAVVAAADDQANLRLSPDSVRRRHPGNIVVDVDTDTAQTRREWQAGARNATYERGSFYSGPDGTPVDAMTNGAARAQADAAAMAAMANALSSGPIAGAIPVHPGVLAHLARATPSPSTSVARIGQQLLDQEQQRRI